MKSSKFHLLLFGWLLVTFACKKENDRPQWDVNILGPIANVSLGLNNLISDTIVHPDGTGLLQVLYDTTFSPVKLDSLYQLNDTTISTIVRFPGFPATLQPGITFVSNNNNITLTPGDVELKQSKIKSGFIRITIKNTVKSKVNFVYTIPKAKKNGIPFSIQTIVDSGSISDPKYFTQDYDFSGYDIDMTGANGSLVNAIYNNVNATSAGNVQFDVSANDTMVNLQSTLIALKPSYVKGYLGQNTIHLNTTETTGIGRLFRSGLIAIDSVRLQIDLINYIGADGQAYFSSLRSINTLTGTSVDLMAPSMLNRFININRATETGNITTPVIPFIKSFLLDKSNSNITDWVQNLPYQYTYDLKLNINPLGNISGNNDFVYSDYLLSTRIQASMPLRIGANQLALSDTFAFAISNTTNFDRIGDAFITMVADNGFPFDMETQLYLIDASNTITDTLLVPGLIDAAPVDGNLIVIQPKQTRIKIPINEQRKDHLLTAVKIGVRSYLNTANYPQLYPLYDRYRLNIKLIADGLYSIR